MNQNLKHLAERALILSGAAALARRRCRSRALVLAYHNIVPAGEQVSGDASLHLPQEEFGRQLDLMARTHDVVPLAAVLDPASPGERPRVAITFDDAYLGALTAGFDELAQRGMPATVFVAPGLLGGVTWWDALAKPSSGLSPAVREHALDTLAGKGESILLWAKAAGLQPAGGGSRPHIATEPELRRAAARAGFTLGSHTWSHANLCALTPHELEEELSAPFAWLRARYPSLIPWLSYPYGLWSPSVAQVAQRVGYVASLRVEGGWLTESSSLTPHALPRFNVAAGMSLDGLALRLAGIGANR